MTRIDELKLELGKEQSELKRNEEAIQDISIRNISKFLDKASTHRARINELNISITALENVQL